MSKTSFSYQTVIFKITAALLFMTSPSYGQDVTDPSPFKQVCTDLETWTLPKSLPKTWQDKFVTTLNDKNYATTQVLPITYLMQKSPSYEVRLFAQYWLGRIFFSTNLHHLAHKVFLDLVSNTRPVKSPTQVAALACLNAIQKKLPTLTYTWGTYPNFINPNSHEQLSILKSSAYASAKEKISRDPTVNISLELGAFSGDKQVEAALKIFSAAAQGDDKKIEELSSIFKGDPESLPSTLKPDQDLLYLSIGRGIYGAGKFSEAIDIYKRVSNTSNLFSQSLSERAWAFLLQEKYAEAIGMASNLIVGGLKKTFSPDGFSVGIIALNETCNFPEAIELIRAFRKTYGPTYKWLYDWQNQGSKTNDLYSSVTKFLKKKIKIPERIGLEWIRSPAFISLQENLNFVLDEKSSVPKYWRKMMSAYRGRDKSKLTPSVRYLQQLIGSFNRELPKLESSIVNKINAHLGQINKMLLTSLAEVSENLQRVEVEALNELGERIIIDNAAGPNRKEASKALKHKEDGPVWDWGKFDAASDESAEVWEDELGFLKADLQTHCTK